MPGFDTQQIHAGAEPDSATGARQVPIYQVSTGVKTDPEVTLATSGCSASAEWELVACLCYKLAGSMDWC